MKKIKCILLLLSTMIISGCTTTRNSETVKDQYRLSGYTIFDSSENIIQQSTITYNEDNKPVKIETADSNGEIIRIKTLQYTDFGKLAELSNTLVDISSIKTTFYYNDMNYLVKTETANGNNEVLQLETFKNDNRGNSIECISEYPGNKGSTHFVMEYNDENKIIKTSELNKNGVLIYYSTSNYDEMGNETTYSVYSPEGVMDQRLRNSYKLSNLIKTEIMDDSENVIFHTDYELNDSNKPVRILSYNQYNDLVSRNKIEYDDNGQEAISSFFDHEDKMKECFKKEYDSFGNIVKLTIYNSNNDIISITRNSYTNSPVDLNEKEFNTIIFNN